MIIKSIVPLIEYTPPAKPYLVRHYEVPYRLTLAEDRQEQTAIATVHVDFLRGHLLQTLAVDPVFDYYFKHDFTGYRFVSQLVLNVHNNQPVVFPVNLKGRGFQWRKLQQS